MYNGMDSVDAFERIVQAQMQRHVDVIIRLGAIDLRLVSNVPGFPAQHYFSAISQRPYTTETADYELWCVSMSTSSLDKDFIRAHRDRSYRSDSFANGYYATDHFGAPVFLITRERRYYIFGEELERVVWPYFVKWFLMLHCVDHQVLHLKAAACALESGGTLLLGRGGAGKTVFLTHLCLHGARFVSNSHALVKDGCMRGVASCIRIRPGQWYEALTRTVRTSSALKANELIVDPYEAFDARIEIMVSVKNICILEFSSADRHIIEPLSEQEAYDFAEQFSLALNVYRLEEDLLDLCRDRCQDFSRIYGQMKSQLRELIQQSRCYYISTDIINPTNRDEVLALLGAK